MANYAIGEKVRVYPTCRLGPQTGLNISHWIVNGIGGASLSDSDVAAFFSGLLAPLYKGWLGTGAAFEALTVQRYYPANLTPVTTVADAGPGVGGASTVSGQTSGLVSIRGAVANRHNRGRAYIPFPGATMVTEPYLTSAAGEVQLTAILTELVSQHNIVVGADSVLLLPIIQNATTPGLHQFVVDGIVRPGLATQRRRSFYGRPN